MPKISELTSWTPTTSDTWVMVQWWVNKKFTFWSLPIPTSVQTALDNKVDKVTWKGLSTNDYDNTEKANVAANTSARHTHSNKSLLDTYTQTEVDLADAVSKKHTHTNKTILDQIANNPVETIVAWANITVSRTGNSVTINSTWGWGGGWGWDMYKAVYDPQNIEADAFDRANHTWTQTMSTISDAWDLATLDQVDTAQIVNHAVENTKLAQMNANTVKGRLSWNGTPQDVAMSDLPISTATQTALDWKVSTTWNETIAGIKTFTSPVLSNDVRLTNDTATQWETHADLTVIVRTATTANITLSGTQTIDWQALVANDLVLVKNQSTWSQNWVYVVSAGAWTRATPYSTTDHFNRRYVYAISGTTNTATLWICNTRNPTVWTTATTFAQIPLWIGTGVNQAAAGNHTHTSFATTAASTIWSSIWYRFTSRTATATTGANDLVVVFSWSTASQVETIPAGTAVSNNSGRFITFKNNATVPWTIRQSASNTLDWSASDITLWVWETISVFNTALNTWVSLNKVTASGWSTQIRKLFAIAWTIWATGTNVANTVVVDWSYTISKINMWLWTAWAGATDLIVDINLNWTSICSTTKPKITWTNQSSINTWTITTTTCVSWNVFTIDIDQIQSTPWVDLYVELVLI